MVASKFHQMVGATLMLLTSQAHATDRSDSCAWRFGRAAPLRPAMGEVFHQIYGSNHAETIVLIHGLDSASQTFDTIAEALGRQFRVIVYDQRGHGRTVARGEDYSTYTMAADLNALLDHLQLGRVHLLGHSMGGRTAARFAEQYPERTASVIIEDMELIRRSQASNANTQRYLEMSRKLREQFDGKTFESRQSLISALEPIYGNESDSLIRRRAKENPDGTWTLLFRPDVSILYGFQANSEDLSEALQKSGKKVLVMQSDPREGSAMSSEGVRHAQSIAGASVVKFSGAGHTIHRTHPEATLEVVRDFLLRGSVSEDLVRRLSPPPRPRGSVDIEAIFQIVDPKLRVSTWSQLEASELSEAQMGRLIERAPTLTNSFEISQFLRIAEDSLDSRWRNTLSSWSKQWEQSQVEWQRRLAQRCRRVQGRLP